MDGGRGQLFPVNPAAVGIVKRDIVEDNEGTAGGGGTESAQRDSLTGGVGHERARPAEELEAGDLAQSAVESRGGGFAELLRAEDARAGRAVGGGQGGSVGRDDHRLKRPLEDDGERSGGGNRHGDSYVMRIADLDLRSSTRYFKGAV